MGLPSRETGGNFGAVVNAGISPNSSGACAGMEHEVFQKREQSGLAQTNTVRRRLANVGNCVMRQDVPIRVAALGYSEDQTLPDLEDAGGAREHAVSASAKKGGLQFRGHRGICDAKLSLDRQPHRHIGRRHVHLAADDASRPLECRLKGHIQATSPWRDRAHHVAELARKGMLAQQRVQIAFGARTRFHGTALDRHGD